MQLTKAEEQIMQIMWDMGEGMVRDIRDRFSDPKPARNTVSTIIRVLESKGVVSYRPKGEYTCIFPAGFQKRILEETALFAHEELF